MPFFNWGKKSDEEVEREQRSKATVAALEAGGIPVQARERLERERALGSNFFSSDLSAREYLLARETGLQVVGQVMGTSFFNVSYLGLSRGRWRSTGELFDISRAQLDARRLAISRMKQEAQILGATGVIGVRIQGGHHEWSQRMVEFTAVGTAVRVPGVELKEPFTSALSAQEFWLLHNAGYIPVGVALGVCSYYMYTDQRTQNMLYSFFGGNNFNNQEVPLYTEGFQAARNESMNRLSNDIYEHRADGVVGMDVDYSMEHIEYEINERTYHDLIAHFVAMGTSVNYRPEAQKRAQSPLLCINLSKSKLGGRKFEQLDDMKFGVFEEASAEFQAAELNDED
jgi:uncharacterized protein YbjQ (UPF0145 family)